MIKLFVPIDKTKKYKPELRGFWYSQESKKLYYDYIITKRYKNSNKSYIGYLKKKYNQESLFYLQNGQAKIFYNRDKIEKRKKLVHDLIKKNIPSNFNRKLIIKIIDKENISSGYSKIKSIIDTRTGDIKSTIYIDLIALKDRIKSGYSDDYYKGRKNKLNFVLHNKKLALHFVILHELGHIVNTSFNHNSDVYADDYAISELKNQGLLKEIRYIEDWSCD